VDSQVAVQTTKVIQCGDFMLAIQVSSGQIALIWKPLGAIGRRNSQSTKAFQAVTNISSGMATSLQHSRSQFQV
jgi:hypothetical protein